MTLLRYVGPHDEVHVPAAGVTAQRGGDPVQVTDEEVAASLLAQETWVDATRPGPAAPPAPLTQLAPPAGQPSAPAAPAPAPVTQPAAPTTAEEE